MRTLFLLLNTRCDIECSYCFYTTGHEARDDAFFDDNSETFIERLRRLKFGKVILSGGDPLNRGSKHRVIPLIAALSEAGLAVIVNTSAAFLTSEDCAALAAAHPARVDISIDSHIRQIHNAQRGRFTDCVDAITRLVALGIDVQTTTVVTDYNKDSLDETLSFLGHLGVLSPHLQPSFVPIGGPTSARTMRSRLTMDDRLRSTLRKRAAVAASGNSASSYYALWEKYWGDDTLAPPQTQFCRMGKSIFVADASGELFGCFHRRDIRLGNIYDPLDAIEAALAENPLTAPPCPDCVGPHCVSLFDGDSNWREGHRRSPETVGPL